MEYFNFQTVSSQTTLHSFIFVHQSLARDNFYFSVKWKLEYVICQLQVRIFDKVCSQERQEGNVDYSMFVKLPITWPVVEISIHVLSLYLNCIFTLLFSALKRLVKTYKLAQILHLHSLTKIQI